VALLIALFALLLICVIGVALIMASGTHSALTGNYRSATSVYYAALAGLEEGRGRLLPKSPNYLGVFGAPPGGLLNPGDVRYIINPLPGETVAPWNVGTPTTFPDTEYQQEFAPNLIPTSAPSLQWINASAPPTGLANPLYKWVRINAVTVGSQQSLNVLVNPIATAPNTPVFYANNRLSVLTPGVQALEITSLAASPNGSQRMLQYVVAPITYNLSFPAALTMEGSAAVTFSGPPTLTIDGTDTLPLGPSCTPGITPVVGLGVAGGAGTGGITGGSVLPPPGAQTVTPATNLQSVGSLDTLAQTVIANADVSKSGAQNQSIFPVTMSASNPVTIAVDGDLDLSTWGTAQGFGILLVTGTLTYDPSSSWSGIILVIGKGIVVSTGTGGGQIIGAALVAQTRDGLGNLLPALGPASWQTAGGSGIKYSSCWVQVVQTPITYKVLSFREIPQITP
jgi:hypothetical protein